MCLFVCVVTHSQHYDKKDKNFFGSHLSSSSNQEGSFPGLRLVSSHKERLSLVEYVEVFNPKLQGDET